MPLVPIRIQGKLRLINLPAGAGAKEQEDIEQENDRRLGVYWRRRYYEGSQYEDENAEAAAAEGIDQTVDRLPEHRRVHAYSTQIAESVDFVANQLAENFGLEAQDAMVQMILDTAMRQSDQFTGEGDDEDPSVEEVVRDALVAGDVAVEVRWDPVEGGAYYEVWESEQVRFDWETRRQLERVTREETVWRFDLDMQSDRQVNERIEYDLITNEVGFLECRRQTFWDDEDSPRMVDMLGIPFIPWVLVRGLMQGLREMRGRSLITDQSMRHADRYNATEQLSYIIARYNSYGNLAVVGDTAALEARREERISKDVADVLTFPGGTGVHSITLPTDPRMIEHQKNVLAEAIYESFGLTQMRTETLTGLGKVSGYALEILNRKTEGTFRRIRRNIVRDLKGLFAMTLDMTAYRRVETDVDALMPMVAADGTTSLIAPFWTVEPDVTFPNRRVTVRLGTGYIVDDVMIRDDFVSNLISRREALRQRGFDDDRIAQIEQEIEDAEPEEVGRFARFPGGTRAGATLNAAGRGAGNADGT